jgi:hypothetical protein
MPPARRTPSGGAAARRPMGKGVGSGVADARLPLTVGTMPVYRNHVKDYLLIMPMTACVTPGDRLRA